ncbi:MAG: chorismate-binding protein, partial [Candidatus Margulisbacteria bacterium]|nr:chorismate-binding protein [Candidatus Margulisiibacteriota bacterium]
MRILLKKYLFDSPAFIIECHKLSEVERAFARMERAVKDGYYLAGFFSYEAGYAFEEVFHDNKIYDFPLVCFGAYRKPTSPAHANRPPSPFKMERGKQQGARKDYLKAIRKIKRLIAAGETYQINYTFRQRFGFAGEPFALYQRLKASQPTAYSAFIESKDFSILSLSPELFFRKTGGRIAVKPMKGTIGPGRDNAGKLKNDKKNRAENIMIVDLLRNDLGRIAKTGSVRTKKLFEVEKLKTLYQMTSTVEARVAPDIELFELFRNIYPSGSVTGAPKIRAMQIIRELEKEERKIYTGSIGFITPQKDMVFNVAIRTLLLHPYPSSSLPVPLFRCELGLGSGIIFDSEPEAEFEECRLK